MPTDFRIVREPGNPKPGTRDPHGPWWTPWDQGGPFWGYRNREMTRDLNGASSVGSWLLELIGVLGSTIITKIFWISNDQIQTFGTIKEIYYHRYLPSSITETIVHVSKINWTFCLNCQTSRPKKAIYLTMDWRGWPIYHPKLLPFQDIQSWSWSSCNISTNGMWDYGH